MDSLWNERYKRASALLQDYQATTSISSTHTSQPTMAASTQLRNYFPVTGRSTTQQVFDRLPVQELQADHPYQWTLFILGFAYIKDTQIPFPGVVQPSLNGITSLMEIGAIHGKPYREWPGDRRIPAEAQVDFSYQDKKDMNPFPSRFGGELTRFFSDHRLIF